MGSSFPSTDFAVLQRAHMGGGPRLQGLPEKFAVTLLWVFFVFAIAHKSRVHQVSTYRLPYLHLSSTPELLNFSS